MSLRFMEFKCWINSIDPYGWFQLYFRYWLGRASHDNEKQTKKWKDIVKRFKSKLASTIKNLNG